MVDHGDLVGELVRFFEILRGEQERRPVRDEFADDVPHREAAARIEAGRRFVEEEHRRREDDAGGEVEAAAHAAGIGLRDPRGGVRQVEAFEQFVRPLPRLRAGRW